MQSNDTHTGNYIMRSESALNLLAEMKQLEVEDLDYPHRHGSTTSDENDNQMESGSDDNN